MKMPALVRPCFIAWCEGLRVMGGARRLVRRWLCEEKLKLVLSTNTKGRVSKIAILQPRIAVGLAQQ